VLEVSVEFSDRMEIPAASVSFDDISSHRVDRFGFVRFVTPPGTHDLRVRSIGAKPVDTSLRLEDDTTRITVRLQPIPQQLDSMKIVASALGKPARYDATSKFDDFYRRKASAVDGRFFAREDIEKRDPREITELFQGMAGVRITHDVFGKPIVAFPRCTDAIIGGAHNDSTIKARTAKQLEMFVDGVKTDDPFGTLQMLKPADVEAIELYHGVAELPPEARGDGCAAIFIWTRYTPGSVRQP
jgi:hypothetical protein